MEHSTMTLNELLPLIEGYFECTLTDAQERDLRKVIAETSLNHPAIDEIRAVMGFRQPAAKATNRVRYRALAVAASLSLLVCVGISLLSLPSHTDGIANECVAYVNGQRITDESAVLELLARDMNGASFADDMLEFRQDLSEAADIIDSYQTINFEI